MEYLRGTPIGAGARKYIESGNAWTPSIVLAELRRWYLREIDAGRRSEREMRTHFAFIEAMTQVVPLDTALAARAGETDFLMKQRIPDWPLADSIIYATARELAAQVVTGDPHFEGLEDVLFLSS